MSSRPAIHLARGRVSVTLLLRQLTPTMTDQNTTANAPMPGAPSPTAPIPSHSVSAPSADRLGLLDAAFPKLAKLSPPPTQESIACLKGLCSYTPRPPAEP